MQRQKEQTMLERIKGRGKLIPSSFSYLSSQWSGSRDSESSRCDVREDQQLEGLPALPSGRSILSRGKERAMSALHRPGQVLATVAKASAQCWGYWDPEEEEAVCHLARAGGG